MANFEDFEEDYMSDSILAQCESKSNSQIKNSQNQHRPIGDQKLSKREMKKQSLAILNQGLQTPISESNKGFDILKKMGFKPGESLGKSKMGIVEPLKLVQLKANKKGLGKATVQKTINHAENECVNMLEIHQKGIDYYRNKIRTGLARKAASNELRKHLLTCQNACENLDMESSKKIPDQPFYWKETTLVKLEIFDVFDSSTSFFESNFGTVEEMIALIQNYLREKYIYCPWCMVRYEDTRELDYYCPGPSYSVHPEYPYT